MGRFISSTRPAPKPRAAGNGQSATNGFTFLEMQNKNYLYVQSSVPFRGATRATRKAMPDRPTQDDYATLPVDAPERRRLPLLLRRAWYGLNQAFRRSIASADATPDQFTVLRTLHEGSREGFIQSELARSMSSDPNTMAALLERMEKNGWLERKQHKADRRANRIRLRAAGRRKFAELRDIAAGLQGRILEAIPEPRREGFLAELALIADSCHAAAQSAATKKR